MDLGLSCRKFLITGGSAGLGLAAAKSLVAEGADVAICRRSQERLDEGISALQHSGQDIVGFRTDVTGPHAISDLREKISERSGSVLDGLSNNAGLSPVI